MAPRRKEAFLVTFWCEPSDEGAEHSLDWRGSVVHLTTQQRRYFTEIVDLVAFLTDSMRTDAYERDASRLLEE